MFIDPITMIIMVLISTTLWGMALGMTVMYFTMKPMMRKLEKNVRDLQEHIDQFTLYPGKKYDLRGRMSVAPMHGTLIPIRVAKYQDVKGVKAKMDEKRKKRGLWKEEL